MFNSIIREVCDILGQLWRMDYGWRTFGNVIKQAICYFS